MENNFPLVVRKKSNLKLDQDLFRLQTRIQKSETLFALTQAHHDCNVPKVANKIGHQATEVIDQLYEN